MNSRTHKKLIRDGRYFIIKNFGKKRPSDNELIDRIYQKAYHCQPASWSNLKQSIAICLDAVNQHKLAAKIRLLKNPAVAHKDYPKIPKKIKNLTAKDQGTIFAAIDNYKNETLKSAVFLAFHVGARPSEFHSITSMSSSAFRIATSKKSDDGKRGIDREIIINDSQVADGIRVSMAILKDIKVKKLQDNFAYLMKTIFPRRKKRPTFYVFRHQLASAFKAGGLSKEMIAYLMGHQSTRTQDCYGHKKSGRGRSICVESNINESEVKSIIRDGHSKREAEFGAKYRENGSPPTNPRTHETKMC